MSEKISIEVCVGTSCHLMGSNLIMECLDRLADNIKEKIDLRYVQCMDRCGKGPNVRIAGVVLDKVTPETVVEEIKKSLI
ncbi:(2Fe-2S) ferredoxin domain-containing protein [Halocella sp. SP3-1]|uniref:(2Fe-2S) ferredoxin domain-containing protein n=1 Tax=Halocella sp. SP3-1 TaxID=2382161 RepID=UPI000F75AB2E|nr:(2Fe-2S) ferredoxin domain-containing protein [Halocella sp. SP3-1]AZO96293.1 (2Fe-2S) ferredoxin domain-containing protein [Halocella sp. SP3-1]